MIVADKCLLRDRLREARMTQKQLSEKIGMSVSQINDYANNRRMMSINTAATISQAIGCTMTDLYTWKVRRRVGD